MLESRDFTIFTDHKLLIQALFRVSLPWSVCQQCHLSYLAKFTCSVVHVPGLKNCSSHPLRTLSSSSSSSDSAPALPLLSSASNLVFPSTCPHCSVESVISGFDISLHLLQPTCASVSEMKSSPSISVVSVPLGAEVLLCDSSTGSLLPLIPLQLHHQLFNLLHDVSHPGVRASPRLISLKFVWPGLSCDVVLWARTCLRCQQSKTLTHVHSTVPAILVPIQRFSH